MIVPTTPLAPSFHIMLLSPSQGMDALFTPRTNQRAILHCGFLYNRSLTAGRCGLGSRMAASKYEAGQITAAGVYTSDTADFQLAAANVFPVSTLVNNTGAILSASERWNFAKIVVGTAHAGGAPVYALQYWNGSAWTSLSAFLLDTLNFGAATTQHLLFTDPADWVAGAKDDAGNTITKLNGQYAIKIKATTAPTITAAVIGGGLLGTIQVHRHFPADTEKSLELSQVPVIVGVGDSLTAYWAAADAGNYVMASGYERQ